MTCPSDLALETYLVAPGRTPASGHLDSCAECQARLARMRAEGEEFRREVLPATVGAVLEAGAPARASRRNPWFVWAPVPAFAAAAAALAFLIVRPASPGADYLGVKGAGLVLAAFSSSSSAGGPGQPVEDGATVPATAALRFRVRAAAPCWLWLVSVDAGGQVSRLYPVDGASGAQVRGEQSLPGGAVLDGSAGPERLFAVCTAQPWPFASLEAAAKASVGGDVRRVKALGGAPAGAAQASLLLEKRP
ncbi:MAG TPA: DUF4384 domain-containing protein [Myxococcales bacterium]|jgi:hypothetical protein